MSPETVPWFETWFVPDGNGLLMVTWKVMWTVLPAASVPTLALTVSPEKTGEATTFAAFGASLMAGALPAGAAVRA